MVQAEHAAPHTRRVDHQRVGPKAFAAGIAAGGLRIAVGTPQHQPLRRKRLPESLLELLCR